MYELPPNKQIKLRKKNRAFRAHYIKYPAPAVGRKETNDGVNKDATENLYNAKDQRTHQSRLQAGTLPDSTNDLPKAARGLLMRLLERDPRVRMRSLRQMQQSAFFMGFNFEHVKAKKVSPRTILKSYFPDSEDMPVPSIENLRLVSQEVFSSFDQPPSLV